jgi:hypothetical protein
MGDIQARFLPTGVSVPDVSVTGAAVTVEGASTPLQVQEIPDEAPGGRAFLLQGVPLVTGAVVEVKLSTGQSEWLAPPEIGLMPQVLRGNPGQTEARPGLWAAIGRAVGIQTSDAPDARIEVRSVAQWELDVVPAYGPMRDGRPALDDDTPASEVLTEAAISGNTEDLQRLFGSPQPFTAVWSFAAKDTQTGGPVQVLQHSPAPGVVAVFIEPSEGTAANGAVHISFPSALREQIVELEATCQFSDSLGHVGTIRHRLWNVVLTGTKFGFRTYAAC